jgi:hypothetical protein
MRTGVKLVGFALALLTMFVIGLGIGRAVGPLAVDDTDPQRVEQQHEMPDMEATR